MREQAIESVELIERAEENVNSIAQIIERLMEMNDRIVKDNVEQDQVLQSVAERLTTIVTLAEQSAQTTKQSNDASEQVGELMGNLHNAVTRFKV